MTDPSTPPPGEPTEVDGETSAVPVRPGRPGYRSRLLLGAAAIVVVALVVTLVVTTTGGDDRPVPSGTIPTLGGQFATPPPASTTPGPAAPASLPAYPGDPVWTVQLPGAEDDADPPGLAVTDQGYVLEHREDVVGLSKAGDEIWRYTPPKVDYFTTRVAGPRVFVGYANPDDRWPQPDVIIALDAATGKEIWRETEASFWSVTDDTIYMSVCYGGQNDHIGDCTVSARDPRTNRTRWQVATYASASVVNADDELQAGPTPPYLLIGSYPTGRDSFVLSTHDAATGALRGRGFRGKDGKVGSVADPTARTVVTIDDNDRNPADGCQAVVTGFSVSGAAKNWQYIARTTKEDDGRRCARQQDSYNHGRLGVTAKNGAPSVLNVDTGAIEWSAPAGGDALAASDTTLLVVEADKNEDGAAAELVAYRIGNAKPLWRAPFIGAVDTSTVTITATRATVIDYAGEAAGYDLTTGNGWSYGDAVQQETPDWFAVCGSGTCRGYTTN